MSQRPVVSSLCHRHVPHRSFSAAPTEVTSSSPAVLLEARTVIEDGVDDDRMEASFDEELRMLPIPIRSHPHVFPGAPLSRLGFGSAPRASLSMAAVTSALSSYLWRSGNVVELVRPHRTEVADALRRFVQEAGPEHGQSVKVVMAVSWRDVVEFIEEQRREYREQQRVDLSKEERRQRRERIKQQNLLNQQRDEALRTGAPLPPPLPSEPLPSTSASASPEAAPLSSSAAPPSSAEDDDELLPIHRLDLITNDAPISFASIDLFPYLHAYLVSVLEASSLSHVSLLLLDDVDGLVPADLPLYLHQWFVAFEQCVLAERVQWYGVASGRMGRQSGAQDWVSVRQLIDTAKGITDRPHLAAIRFPLNVFDSSVLEELNCQVDGLPASTLDYAKSKGLLCLSEAVVDTMDEKGEERRLLSGPAGDGRAMATELQAVMNAAMFLEKRFEQRSKESAEAGDAAEGARRVDRMEVSWAHIMAAQMATVDNAVRWERILNTVIRPALRPALSTLAASYPEDHALAQWARDYRQVTNLLFASFTHAVNSQAALLSEEINAFLDELCPALQPFRVLEQKAVVLALATGVDCVMMSEVDVGLDALKVGWEVEKKDPGEDVEVASEAEASFPINELSRDEALSVMKKCRERFVSR